MEAQKFSVSESQGDGTSSGLMRKARAIAFATLGLVTAASGCDNDKPNTQNMCMKDGKLCPDGSGANGTGGTNIAGNGGTGLNEGGQGGHGTGGNGTGGTGLEGGQGGNAGNGGTGGTGLEGGTGGLGGNGTGGTGLNEGGNGTGGTGLSEGGTGGQGGNAGSGGANEGGNGSGGNGGGEVGDPCLDHFDCEDTLLCCNDICIEQTTQNCFECGNVCPSNDPVCWPDLGCQDGCAGTFVNCNNICRDASSDEGHCGGCNKPCDEGETCVATGLPDLGHCQ